MKKIIVVDLPDLREGEQIFVNYGNSETGYLVPLRHQELTLPSEEEIKRNAKNKYPRYDLMAGQSTEYNAYISGQLDLIKTLTQ